MATANDVVTAALRRINAYSAGQPLDPNDASDALSMLNDMIESWSLEHLMIFNSIEQVVTWTAGPYQYTGGNPPLGTAGATFVTSLSNGSPTFTVAGISSLQNFVVGAVLQDRAGAIPAGTTVADISGTTVTMSANATAAAPNDDVTFGGQLAFALPTRINNVFSRLSTNLDYPCEVVEQGRYTSVGIKNLPGPWPTILYYNRQWPVGQIFVWKVPQTASEGHLWVDYIFDGFSTLSSSAVLPEGYVRALKWNLACELAPVYGREVTADLRRAAMESKAAIKALNMVPTPEATFDSALMSGQKRRDAGWYLSGGFR